MKEIEIKNLTKESFSQYGQFDDFLHPTGQNLGMFYHDHIIFPVSGQMPLGFSPMLVQKPNQMIVTQMEYHDFTCEGVLALDDDIVIYVSLPSNGGEPESIEAFLVPKGTMVTYHVGVWHCSPFAVHNNTAHTLVVLPQRVYHNDCHVITLALNKQVLLHF